MGPRNCFHLAAVLTEGQRKDPQAEEAVEPDPVWSKRESVLPGWFLPLCGIQLCGQAAALAGLPG